MSNNEWLASQFEGYRGHLQSVAYRILGSSAEADDAVQTAWLRLSRIDADTVENLGGWLTTVVARVCLDILRSRNAKREEILDASESEFEIALRSEQNPEEESVLADSVGLALLVVLDTLNPDERLAFVLHDIFGMPFEDVAPIVERSVLATRQLASRARRRLQGKSVDAEANQIRQREIVKAFLVASREGSFDALLALLDPNVVFRADAVAARMGAPATIQGADEVAKIYVGRARGARVALIDGVPGFAVVLQGKLSMAFKVTFAADKIAAIDVIADPARLVVSPNCF